MKCINSINAITSTLTVCIISYYVLAIYKNVK